jgi:NodT family efflux transporter outer membrane factor (OMF) lipoprotein
MAARRSTPRRSIARVGALAAALAALAGCNVGPDFAPPDPGLPNSSFTAGEARGALLPQNLAPPSPTWWEAFRDPVLTELEARVAAANLDVQTATVRLAESRFQRGVAASAQLPSVNANAKYQYELFSQNGIAGLLTKLAPAASAAGMTIPAISDYTIGFDASWELDLWGHVRRSVESADAQVEQSAEMRRDTLVSSLAELARDYVQLRGAQTQIAIANANLRIAREIQKLAEERQRKGVATGFDAQTSTAQAESISARIPTLLSDESQYSNAIGFLLDEPPGALQAELGPRKKRALAPPGPPLLGVPSELARRRPDIRAAEARLHAATADIGVAVAAFYPTIKLNGVVSLDALDAKKLFRASSLQYNAGPSIVLPIFDAGRLKSTLELRKAEQLEAAIAYHKTVLQAWREVVDALTAYRREAERRAGLRRQMEHSRQALDIARSRYKIGVGEFLAVLDAERSFLQAAQDYETSTTNVSLDLVSLYKALGGGWEECFPDGPVEPEPVAYLPF